MMEIHKLWIILYDKKSFNFKRISIETDDL
jgi:hypothetical protein